MLSCVLGYLVLSKLFVTPWTLAHQASLSMGFPRQEYWSRLPFPPPGDLPKPGVKPESPAAPALADGLLTSPPPGNNLGLRYPTIKKAEPRFQLLTKKMHKSCELSFIWGQMRPAAQKTAPQIVLRDCSKGAVGEGYYTRFR